MATICLPVLLVSCAAGEVGGQGSAALRRKVASECGGIRVVHMTPVKDAGVEEVRPVEVLQAIPDSGDPGLVNCRIRFRITVTGSPGEASREREEIEWRKVRID